MSTPSNPADLREHVRASYAATAQTVMRAQDSPGCCGDTSGCCGDVTVDAGDRFGAARYADADKATLPGAAVQASLGCGNPLAVADLHSGETVLDLGSGGGIDVLLSAKRVGPTGKAYGLDVAEEMLELARRNAAEAGAENVEFLRGDIEDIPLPPDSVDVVISNCVINLSVDKPAVFASMHSVLRDGGRIGVSDIVAEDHLTPEQKAERGGWVGCVAGALSITEYRQGLTDAGFEDVTVEPTHQVAEGMHSAIIRAVKPANSAAST